MIIWRYWFRITDEEVAHIVYKKKLRHPMLPHMQQHLAPASQHHFLTFRLKSTLSPYSNGAMARLAPFLRCSRNQKKPFFLSFTMNMGNFSYKVDRLILVTGYSKKSVSWAFHLFFVRPYCCFIQTWCINNDWKCDFWHLRCLFYQVESILFHFD